MQTKRLVLTLLLAAGALVSVSLFTPATTASTTAATVSSPSALPATDRRPALSTSTRVRGGDRSGTNRNTERKGSLSDDEGARPHQEETSDPETIGPRSPPRSTRRRRENAENDENGSETESGLIRSGGGGGAEAAGWWRSVSDRLRSLLFSSSSPLSASSSVLSGDSSSTRGGQGEAGAMLAVHARLRRVRGYEAVQSELHNNTRTATVCDSKKDENGADGEDRKRKNDGENEQPQPQQAPSWVPGGVTGPSVAVVRAVLDDYFLAGLLEWWTQEVTRLLEQPSSSSSSSPLSASSSPPDLPTALDDASNGTVSRSQRRHLEAALAAAGFTLAQAMQAFGVRTPPSPPLPLSATGSTTGTTSASGHTTTRSNSGDATAMRLATALSEVLLLPLGVAHPSSSSPSSGSSSEKYNQKESDTPTTSDTDRTLSFAQSLDGDSFTQSTEAVYRTMRTVAAGARYGSADCGAAMPPALVAQCFTRAVIGMSPAEMAHFLMVQSPPAAGTSPLACSDTSTAGEGSNESGTVGADTGSTVRGSPPPPSQSLPSIFQDVAAFRGTLCAQLLPCMAWAVGRIDNNPDNDNSRHQKQKQKQKQTAQTPSNKEAGTSSSHGGSRGSAQRRQASRRLFLEHFGSSFPSSSLPAMAQLKKQQQRPATASTRNRKGGSNREDAKEGAQSPSSAAAASPFAALLSLRSQLIEANAVNTDTSPLLPLQPFSDRQRTLPQAARGVVAASSSSSSSSSSSWVQYSVTGETLQIVAAPAPQPHIEPSWLRGIMSDSGARRNRSTQPLSVLATFEPFSAAEALTLLRHIAHHRGERFPSHRLHHHPQQTQTQIRTSRSQQQGNNRNAKLGPPANDAPYTAMPGVIAFSGDSLMRGLFGSFVGLLRTGPHVCCSDDSDRDDHHGTNMHNQWRHVPWEASVAHHSKQLYLRYRSADVLLADIRDAFNTGKEADRTIAEALREAAEGRLEAMLADISKVSEHDVVHFFHSVTSAVRRELCDEPFATMHWLLTAARRFCDASTIAATTSTSTATTSTSPPSSSSSSSSSPNLCPTLILAYEFDNLAQQPRHSFMPPTTATLFANLLDGMRTAGYPLETSDHLIGPTATAAAIAAEASVASIMPVSAHIHYVGLHPNAPPAVAARQVSSLFGSLLQSLQEEQNGDENEEETRRPMLAASGTSQQRGPTLRIQRLPSGFKVHRNGGVSALLQRLLATSASVSTSASAGKASQQQQGHAAPRGDTDETSHTASSPPSTSSASGSLFRPGMQHPWRQQMTPTTITATVTATVLPPCASAPRTGHCAPSAVEALLDSAFASNTGTMPSSSGGKRKGSRRGGGGGEGSQAASTQLSGLSAYPPSYFFAPQQSQSQSQSRAEFQQQLGEANANASTASIASAASGDASGARHNGHPPIVVESAVPLTAPTVRALDAMYGFIHSFGRNTPKPTPMRLLVTVIRSRVVLELLHNASALLPLLVQEGLQQPGSASSAGRSTHSSQTQQDTESFFGPAATALSSWAATNAAIWSAAATEATSTIDDASPSLVSPALATTRAGRAMARLLHRERMFTAMALKLLLQHHHQHPQEETPLQQGQGEAGAGEQERGGGGGDDAAASFTRATEQPPQPPPSPRTSSSSSSSSEATPKALPSLVVALAEGLLERLGFGGGDSAAKTLSPIAASALTSLSSSSSSMFVYDAELLQGLFPFGGFDETHFNTMIKSFRSVPFCHTHRLGCVLKKCDAKVFGAATHPHEVYMVEPMYGQRLGTSLPGLFVSFPVYFASSRKSKAARDMAARTAAATSAVSGSVVVSAEEAVASAVQSSSDAPSSSDLPPSPPSPLTTTDLSEGVRSWWLDEPLQLTTTRTAAAVGSAAAAEAVPIHVGRERQATAADLAAFFVRRHSNDMLVGAGCDHMRLGADHMLPLPRGHHWGKQGNHHQESVDGESGGRGGEGEGGATSREAIPPEGKVAWRHRPFSLTSDATTPSSHNGKSTTTNTKANVLSMESLRAIEGTLLPQTPSCSFLMGHSYAPGGRNPLQNLEMQLILTYMANAQHG